MKTTISVRSARRKDIPSIVKFNLAMARETEDLELDEATLYKGVQAVFGHPEKGFYLMCNIDDEPVACLMVTREWSDWRNGTFYWIQSVYVAEKYRRQGVYRELYQYLKKHLSNKSGVAGLRLYVEKNNHPAQITYANLGMQKTDYHIFEEALEKNPAPTEK